MCVLKLFSHLFDLRICLCNSGQDLTPKQLFKKALVTGRQQYQQEQLPFDGEEDAAQPSVAEPMPSCSPWAELSHDIAALPPQSQTEIKSNEMNGHEEHDRLYSCQRCRKRYHADKVMSAGKGTPFKYSLDERGNVCHISRILSSDNPEDIAPGVHFCKPCLTDCETTFETDERISNFGTNRWGKLRKESYNCETTMSRANAMRLAMYNVSVSARLPFEQVMA